jgi:hypothetical protein
MDDVKEEDEALNLEIIQDNTLGHPNAKEVMRTAR